MIHTLRIFGPVFVDNGKRRRTDGIGLDPKFLADGRNEGCLAGTHRGIESNNAAVADFPDETGGGSSKVRE